VTGRPVPVTSETWIPLAGAGVWMFRDGMAERYEVRRIDVVDNLDPYTWTFHLHRDGSGHKAALVTASLSLLHPKESTAIRVALKDALLSLEEARRTVHILFRDVERMETQLLACTKRRAGVLP
jgi:hypothetical protein